MDETCDVILVEKQRLAYVGAFMAGSGVVHFKDKGRNYAAASPSKFPKYPMFILSQF